MLKRIVAAFCAAWISFAFAADKPLNQVTGTITTQNLVTTGDATAGSAVEIDVTGIASVTVQVTGTYTASGGLSAQITTDRRNWVTECSSSCTTTFTRRTTGAQTATITSGQQDIYQVQFANGAKRLRVTALGAVTGTATITIQPSDVGAGSGGSGGGGGAVTNAGTFAVQESGSALTALQVMDDWDESDRAKVNVIVGQAGVAAGAGAVGATVIRTTQASDSPVVTNQGAQADAACATDNGTCSEIALKKRIAQNLSTLNTNVTASNSQLPSSLGPKTAANSLSTVGPTVASATLSNVAASATSVTCLASNASRAGAVIFNDSVSATLYVKPGATASTTSFTWQVPPGGSLTLEAFPLYTGILDCIWSAASGNARVTEF